MATVGSYLLAIVGFSMMVSAVLRTLSSNLKYIYTRPLLINALRTNANHAEHLCKTAPESYFGAIGAAIKTAAMCQSRDLKVVNGATVPSYDAVAMAVSMRWKQLLGRVKLGAMAAGGAVALGLSKGVPPIPVIVLAVGVGIGFLWLYFFNAEIDRCMILARAEILPGGRSRLRRRPLRVPAGPAELKAPEFFALAVAAAGRRKRNARQSR